MNRISRTLALVVLALGTVATTTAFAQHRHWHGPRVGVYLGGPAWWGPGWYPPSYSYYYSYPPVVVAPPAPPPTVYVERAPVAEAQPQAQASWYYCRDPEGYYPYVRECKRPWEPVAPRPAQ